MANLFSGFMDFFKLDDDYDDDYDDYDDEYEEQYDRKKEKEEKRLEKERKAQEKEQQASKTSFRSERTGRGKVIPIRKTHNGFEVCIVRPDNISDAQDACDMLLNGCAVVVNLEGIDIAKAQSIMDFISGCLYSIQGSMQQISKYIFVFTPDNIDITGDSLDFSSDENLFATLDQEF